jgi:hypothetical protein
MKASEQIRPDYMIGEPIRRESLLSSLNGNASETLVSELRRLVDEWLDSGRSGGIEMPKTRTLENTPTAYSEMNRWLGRNRPVSFATPSGEIRYMIGPNSFPADGQCNSIRESKEAARRMFVLLMDSPVKYALFRCHKADCGRYYILERPRGTYKRWTYCPQHRTRVSALRGTKEKRERERIGALEIASNALGAWPGLTKRTRAKHKTAKGYIASKLSHLGLTAKWVTRNLSEIENRAKGDDHAKG